MVAETKGTKVQKVLKYKGYYSTISAVGTMCVVRCHRKHTHDAHTQEKS